MATPVYNQVALPQLGGSAQAAADAQVSSSLSNLGASLTGLESRLETRKQAKIDRDNAKAKNIFETALLNAKDENEFNDIVAEFSRAATADGFVLPDQAASIQASRTARLKDEESRQLGRGLGAEADEGVAAARLKILEADTADLEADADKVYGPRFAAALDKAYTKPEEYAAEMAAITRDMSISHPGVDLAKRYTTVDGTANEGIVTRGARDTELTNNATNATTRSLQPSALLAGIAQNRFTAVSNNSLTSGVIRSDALGEQERTADAKYEEWRSKALTNAGLKDTIYNDPDLPPAEKNRLLLRAETEDVTKTSIIGEFSGLSQEDTNTLSEEEIGRRRLSNKLYGTTLPIPSDTSKANPKTIVDNMTKQYDIIRNADPAFQIDKRAQFFETSEEYAPAVNGWGNVGVNLSDSVGNTYEIAQGETRILDWIKTTYGFSNAQVLAVAEAAVVEDDGIRGAWNKPEIRNRMLKDKAAAYAKDLRVMGGKYSEIDQIRSEAESYGLLAQEAKSNAARARAKGQTEKAQQYEDMASTYTFQLRRREDLFNSAVSKTSLNPAPEDIANELKSGVKPFGGMVKR